MAITLSVAVELTHFDKEYNMSKLKFSGMDYSSMQVVAVELEMGHPRPGLVKVFDSMGRQLPVEKLQLFIDESTGLYELSFMCGGQEHAATIVNIEVCDAPTGQT